MSDPDTVKSLPALEIAVRTDPGRDPDKQVNEDSSVHVETPQGLLAVVCDGMGGHAGGKEASELAIRTIVEIVQAAPPATPPGLALKRAIEEANARIWNMPTAEAGFRPGSTVVAALFHEGGAEIAHVGDSRIYLVHAGAIAQVTRDHSMVQEMVDRNLIRPEEASKHPDANKILRALGIAKDVDVELRPEPIAYVAGDVFVLCSDGLSDLAEPGDILATTGAHSVAQAAGQLVDLANARGGHDNITAMVIRTKASSRPREAPPLMKTMPLTMHQAPADHPIHGVERGDTQVAPPQVAPTLVSAPQAPTQPMMPGGPPAPPHAAPAASPSGRALSPYPDSPPPSSAHPAPKSSGLLIVGIVLAVVALLVVAGAVAALSKPDHHSVPVVVDDREAGSPVTPDDDDGGAEAPITPAPPLVESAKIWHRPPDAGPPDPCRGLKKAREHDAGPDVIARLEEKCRASGGTP